MFRFGLKNEIPMKNVEQVLLRKSLKSEKGPKSQRQLVRSNVTRNKCKLSYIL